MSASILPLTQFLADPQTKIGERFFSAESWANWRTIFKVVDGLPLSWWERRTYRALSERKTVPSQLRELWVAAGRRGGKTRVGSLLCTWLAFGVDWTPYLAAGERGYILMVYPDRKQGRVALSYIEAFISSTPLLAAMVSRQTAESIELSNGITIEIATCSLRSIRGYSTVCCLCDELSFWKSEDSTEPDIEVLNAVRPTQATIDRALLIVLSTVYSRRGEFYRQYERYFGKEDDRVLFLKATTRELNPAIPQSVVKEALDRDQSSAEAEYLSVFRRDIEGFITKEVIDACKIPNRYELPPIHSGRYCAFVDPSGGSSDSFTLGIAHEHTGTIHLDCLREARPPFSPDGVVQEFAAVCKSYEITSVTGDRYGGEWPRERFRVHGIQYQVADRTKSEFYLDMLPLLNSQRVQLLDHPRLTSQLLGLERRTSRSGRDSIDHAPNSHDDVANAAAGALVLAAEANTRAPVGPLQILRVRGPSLATLMSGERPRDSEEEAFCRDFGKGKVLPVDPNDRGRRWP